ncbi:MAG TPA: ribonuclease J [Candidatus Absconditabacterales bacterium]|nr:ribonuclease J [Candidatus Absconditabacterales bacterium]
MNETQLPKVPLVQTPKTPIPSTSKPFVSVAPVSVTPKSVSPTVSQIVKSSVGSSVAPMQGNLSIDFTKKNNTKPIYRGKKPLRPQGPKMTSEAFLRHRDPVTKAVIADPRKLIKKDEVPVRIIALGGLHEIGINMALIEYKNDIIIIDAGIEFASAEMHGVDYIIPDISYLVKHKKNIRGILITHGHLDHIGALKHVLGDLDFPMVYTTPLALGLIRKSLDDKDNKLLKYKIVDPDMDIIKLGCFTVEIFRVNHSIPESLGYSIYTPKGMIVHAGDYKIDHTPSIDKPADIGKISRIGQEGVRVFLGESTNANKPGHSVSEKIIGDSLNGIIRDCKGRMIISTFASNIGRVIQVIDAAVKYNKVVFLAGRSMINNVKLCQELGYIRVPEHMIRPINGDIEQMPDERVLVLCTGSQGEEFSALMRMSTNTYKDIQLKPSDSILLSSHTIPGNEKAVIGMINDLVAIGVQIIDDNSLDVHSSGHGYQEDIKMMIAMLKPEYYVPMHGEPFMRHANKNLGLAMNIQEQNILLPGNGQAVEMYDNVLLMSDQKLKLDTIMIDGKGQGHLSGEYVMKARGIMAENGIVSLIFKIDTKNNELVGNIQIESRGFVYSSEVKTIHTQIVEFARAKYNENQKRRMDIKDNLRQMKEDLAEFISKIIGRVPLLMPMYVYINREAQNGNADVTLDEAVVGMTLDEQGYDD